LAHGVTKALLHVTTVQQDSIWTPPSTLVFLVLLAPSLVIVPPNVLLALKALSHSKEPLNVNSAQQASSSMKIVLACALLVPLALSHANDPLNVLPVLKELSHHLDQLNVNFVLQDFSCLWMKSPLLVVVNLVLLVRFHVIELKFAISVLKAHGQWLELPLASLVMLVTI